MDVTSISVAKAQEIEDASIVSGHINSAGSLVLVNGAGEEINAGTISVNYVEGRILASDVFSAAANTAGPLFRLPTFDGLPPEDDFFNYHADGSITVKNAGWYHFHGVLICQTTADVSTVGLRVSLIGGAGDPVDATAHLVNPPTGIGLLEYRVDVMFTTEVTAGQRWYFGPFLNKVNTNAIAGWNGMLRISQAGSIVMP